MRIQPGDRVLEIGEFFFIPPHRVDIHWRRDTGTGWGSLSILAAQSVPDCTIDTITLSIHQTTFARKRIADAGLSHRITVHHTDFRESLLKPEWKGAFDKFVSIEMMEHVGKNFIPEYWRVVDWALKEDSAIGMVQVISTPESRAYLVLFFCHFFKRCTGIPRYDRDVDFIQKWVSAYRRGIGVDELIFEF